MKYQKEKEYVVRRAEELKARMIEATKACDKVAFATAYNTAQRYMTRTELRNMMVMFVSHWNN